MFAGYEQVGTNIDAVSAAETAAWRIETTAAAGSTVEYKVGTATAQLGNRQYLRLTALADLHSGLVDGEYGIGTLFTVGTGHSAGKALTVAGIWIREQSQFF